MISTAESLISVYIILTLASIVTYFTGEIKIHFSRMNFHLFTFGGNFLAMFYQTLGKFLLNFLYTKFQQNEQNMPISIILSAKICF